MNQFLQTQFNAQPYASPKYHLFKLKDKVMQTTNREEVKNGEIGVVIGIDPQANNDHFLKVKFGDREINYHRHQVQQQLILAYACSVHKVQGNEFVEVVFVIHREHQFSLKNS